MDKISSYRRSRNMSLIGSKNTKPEVILRKKLFNLGFRYRIHYPIRGKPDIVFTSKRMAIFVNGCFWHNHKCNRDHIPKSNTEFWKAKIKRNLERDRDNVKYLRKNKWKVITIWECEILDNLAGALKKIII